MIVLPREDGQIYEMLWRDAIAAEPDNEWHEGSEIEPSAEYAAADLLLTAAYAGRF